MAGSSNDAYVAQLQAQLQQLNIKKMSVNNVDAEKELNAQIADLRQKIAYTQALGAKYGG